MSKLPCRSIWELTCLFFAAGMLSSLAWASQTDWTNLEESMSPEALADRTVIFYALDLASNEGYVLAADRVDERHRPYSTFKIPNLLIALETGVETSPQSSREWDESRRPATEFWPKGWKQKQTLAMAFRRSAVWYFRDIALEVGGPAYRHWLTRYDYGNAETPDNNDVFWLRGPLEISVLEKVEFIRRLIGDELPVRYSSLQQLVEVSRFEQRDGYVLHGKTGSGPVGDDFEGPFEGWLIGWVDRPELSPVAFVLFVEGPDFASIRTFRKDMSLHFLQQSGFWPE